jgi:DNA-binding response OmpR family regulator
MESPAGHILILEDHPTHRNVVTFNLTSAGYKVTAAAEAAKALVLAQYQHFDLVIADYYLPDYPGTDFVKLLRATEHYQGVPVILLTGRAEELNVQRLREELSVLVLSKPCPIKRLLETVSKCLSLARGAALASGQGALKD